MRLGRKQAIVQQYEQHKNWVVNAHIQRSGSQKIISGSQAGLEIRGVWVCGISWSPVSHIALQPPLQATFFGGTRDTRAV